MKVGYIRVSTVEQNLGRQEEIMKDFKVEKIFQDKVSGKNTDRGGLKAMIEFVREGDTIYIESFSRLARSTKDLLHLVEELKKKQVGLVSHKESLDTSTPTGKLMLTVIGAINEFERECMLERQREGIAIAVKQGKYKGRKKIEFPLEWEKVYNQYKTREITGTRAMEILELKRNTFYNLIKEYEETKN